jgi:cyclo(L-tyrosyl-L-tyrosyl) synthase
MFAVIGMSPGNSYFSQDVINQLLSKALEEYPRVGVLIPDVPAIATYIALGYPENRARTDKAIAQGNAFRNKVKRAIESQGLDDNRLKVFNWAKEDIEGNADYRKQYENIRHLYDTNEEFKRDANAATADVLNENPFRKIPITDLEIERAVHYLLSEFAFMLFVGEYTHEDIVGYIYHKPWPVFERLIAGLYTGRPIEKIEFKRYPEFS